MAKVWNDSRFTLACTQINERIRGGKFVTVSDERAKLVPQNGIFRVEFDEAPKKRSTAKQKAEEAKNEDKGSNADGSTTWFAGDPNASK